MRCCGSSTRCPSIPQTVAGRLDLAFNTAVSFITNTNWQNYGGETTMSYLSQMLGLELHNFISAAIAIAVAVALVRGFARRRRRRSATSGSISRAPRCISCCRSAFSIVFLVWQGMPQTLGGGADVKTLEGAKQTIAAGPVASQEAIKMLGTNGGGFFNANAAHPFENPDSAVELHPDAARSSPSRSALT